MARIIHYYVCLGCGSKHPHEREAIHCCAVVQEIWQCTDCGWKFPREEQAAKHTHENVKEASTI